MQNLTFVTELQPQEYLKHNFLDFFQCKDFIRKEYFLDVLFFVLEYQVQSDALLFLHDDLFELDDVRVLEVTQKNDLTQDSGWFVNVG